MEHSAKDAVSAPRKRARRKKKHVTAVPAAAATPAAQPAAAPCPKPRKHHSCTSISLPTSPRAPVSPRLFSLATEVDRRLTRSATLVDRPPVKIAPGAQPAKHPRLSNIISLEKASLDEVADARFMRTVSSIRSVENVVTPKSPADTAAPSLATDEEEGNNRK